MNQPQKSLEQHTYLDKNGVKIKNPKINTSDILNAYTYLITKSKGKLTTRILRLTFTDKAKDFTKVLLDTNYITLIKKSNQIKISFPEGGFKYISTPNVYKCTDTKVDIKNNRYIQSLYKKLENRKDE
jgi:hypothetical protein